LNSENSKRKQLLILLFILKATTPDVHTPGFVLSLNKYRLGGLPVAH
jgi:hypothetical protein